MILISIISEIVTDKRQFKTDGKASAFLKHINKLHDLHRRNVVGEKPLSRDFKAYQINSKGERKFMIDKALFNLALKDWQKRINQVIPLKIEIINTKHNQINLPVK